MSGYINKIFIDSKFKTTDSKSSSDFKINLIQSIDVPEGTKAYIDDLVITATWFNIQENENNKLYIRRTWTPTTSITTQSTIIMFELPSANYTAETLAEALNLEFNVPWLNNGNAIFGASYDEQDGTLNIISTHPSDSTDLEFEILTDQQLKGLTGQTARNRAGASITIDGDDLESVNTVLGNTVGDSLIYNYNFEGVGNSDIYTSRYLNLIGVHSLYLHSNNLTSYNVLGCRGESSIIAKIPITGNYGSLIIKQNYNPQYDFIEVGKLQLKTLEFSIRDSEANIVDLRGGDISFVIIFYAGM